MVSDALMTAEELLAYPVPHKRTELVNGRLVVREPAGFEHGRVADWLRAGTRLVWVVDPEQRTARLHTADGSERAIPEDGALDGGEVLPGLLVALGDVLS
jgi:Uma2 family endonuclease